ncbi:MAG: hypothetical protein HeimC3_23170 [Candidatus Heimdallarchaeota archaeon LC_3]|nr:MAG: hypothetical protein HeimC3_23170 [Candidatus Heimdallarchaeota archaeon LC_3]
MKLDSKAISKKKLDHAIKLYQEEKISIGRAAELVSIDIWSFHDELNKLGISHLSTLSEFENDLELIKKSN